MAVARMPNQAVDAWTSAQARLARAVAHLPAPRLGEHLAEADRLLSQSGPAPQWADLIAAIAVISERRADLAITTPRREAYLEAATAAYDVLQQAHAIHGVLPCEQALAELRGSPRYWPASDSPSPAISPGVRNSSTNS